MMEVFVKLEGRHVGEPIYVEVQDVTVSGGYSGSYFDPPEPAEVDYGPIWEADVDGNVVYDHEDCRGNPPDIGDTQLTVADEYVADHFPVCALRELYDIAIQGAASIQHNEDYEDHGDYYD